MARRRIMNTMKRLEIAVGCDHLPTVRSVLDRHATGYTFVPDATGVGHHGCHEGEIGLIVTVVTRDHMDPILDELLPILDAGSGIVLVSDVSVLRGEYFTPEVRDRVLRPPVF